MIDLDEMKRDMEAGTPGPWFLEGNWDHKSGNRLGGWVSNNPPAGSPVFALEASVGTPNEIAANARRIARVPDMEATIIAQAATIEALRASVAKADELAVAADQVDAYLTKLQTRGSEPLNTVNASPLKLERNYATALVRNEAREAWAILGNALAAYRATEGAKP